MLPCSQPCHFFIYVCIPLLEKSWPQYKIEASIVDQVHLTAHYGHVLLRSIYVRQTKLRFMWWQLVIGTPHKTFDNFHSQKQNKKNKHLDEQ